MNFPTRHDERNLIQNSDFGFRISDFRFSSGFTLIELLISIALALVLILGVNAVFKYTTNAVGQGQAINAATRDSRAAQATFASDFAYVLPNGLGTNDAASIIIRSAAIPAYRDRADELSDKDANPLTIDIDGNGNEGDAGVLGERISSATYNYRNHRIDTLSFFSRNYFTRQTGNLGTYVAGGGYQEAWIWYGHLWLPTNKNSTLGSMYPAASFPGAGANSSVNPNNHYATQFVLGRVATLFAQLNPPITGTIIDPTTGAAQKYLVDTDVANPYPTIINDLSPLDSNSQTQSTGETYSPYSGTYNLYDSRLDLAETSIALFRSKLANFIATTPAAIWWDRMMDGNPVAANPNSRFRANPFPSKPLSAASMAQASPYFLPGSTQFIVEFAGDFVTQDSNPAHTITNFPLPRTSAAPTRYGDITGLGSDNQIDFTVVNGIKQIIWYGMPRNTSGATTTTYLNGDVVPLRDWLQNAAYNSTTGVLTPLGDVTAHNAPYERLPLPPYYADYTNTSPGSGMNIADAGNGYTCAFGPNDPAPKLIRITINLTDSSGRLPDGLTYQYVFQVPTPN